VASEVKGPIKLDVDGLFVVGQVMLEAEAREKAAALAELLDVPRASAHEGFLLLAKLVVHGDV